MTREIVEGYGGIWAMLEKRRNAEIELSAIRSQIAQTGTYGSPAGYPGWPRIEKVPDKDEYVFSPRGTNNPQGMRAQHEDMYWHALDLAEETYGRLLADVEDLITYLRDNIDRAIMRYYYCLNQCDEEIGPRIRFSRSNVNKRRLAALKELEMKFGQ